MLTTLAHREVEVGGTAEVGTFSIKANGKAFKVLIDGLYSDKARAVVRELWSNAFDSHAAAGCPDKPFDCHLPTVWEPWFAVRDYGVSMTHEGVMRLYTTVFESSKENTNTQVGKLGLGSKSPFAYTDTFTVTAYLDGQKRTYSAFIGQDYIPRIAHMSTDETTEPDGLEVSFPVKTDDTSSFSIAAHRTALGFDVLPNIVGSPQLEPGKKKVILEGTGWKLYDSLGGHEAHAKQGCVVYPITSSAITGLTAAHRDILNSPFLIDFPIGSLEIAASREGLGYDDTTITNIRARLADIERELVAAVEAQIASIKTAHEMMMWMSTLAHSDMPAAMRSVVGKAKWRGRTPFANVTINTNRLQASSVLSFSAYTLRRYVNITKHASTGSHITFNPNACVVYFRDTSVHVTGALARAHASIKSLRADKAMIYVSANLKTHPNAFRRLLAALGRPDPSTIVMVNDLPAIHISTQGVKRPVKVREVCLRKINPRDWTQTDIDANAGGVYVSLDRFDIMDGSRETTADAVQKIIKILNDASLIDGPVYAIPRSLAKKFLREENGWTNLFDLSRELLKTNFNEANAVRRRDILAHVNPDWRIDDVLDVIKCLAQKPQPPIADGLFADVFKHFADLRAELNKAPDEGTWLSLAKLMGVSLPVTPTSFTVPHTSNALEKRYPMLAMLLQSGHFYASNHTLHQVVLDYVNLVDG